MANPEGEHPINYIIQVTESLASEFEAHLSSGPDHEILSKSELVPPLVEKAWDIELSDLRDLIEQARVAYDEGNPIAIKGFQQMLSEGEDAFRYRGRNFGSLDEFVEETIAVLNKGYDDYSNDTKRPVRKRVYLKRGDNSLNPRNIRLLIMGNGLNGGVTSLDELGMAEGYASRHDNINVKGAMRNAQRHLIRALTPDYVYSPQINLSGTFPFSSGR